MVLIRIIIHSVFIFNLDSNNGTPKRTLQIYDFWYQSSHELFRGL